MIDSHCHLTDLRCFPDVDQIMSRGRAQGVTKWVLAGTDPEDWDRQLQLSAKYPESLITNFGLHPWWIEKMTRAEIDIALRTLETKLKFAHGLGETGLDFYEKRDPSKFADQVYAFEIQVKMAVQLQKPLVLHVVKAFDEVLKVLKTDVERGSQLQVPVMLVSELPFRIES